ncbi:hypothetical protein IMCC21906_01709 [Spongiibacter sp. IMCC21906]|uniref:hypothetical protein n=1 Tax=Spongiibacter sp. IMCC21906 TaxID=1620392 RepID=UPI00062DD607|nr:hypothetical protein [Spongiibacter sp. IMCC21906]AKH69385.1 hypothetical protein IMCC21906_01709 [Spongiibacter sp. IMCC21906]
MPIVYEASSDKDCVRYKHFSLVVFYLSNARRHAKLALENHDDSILQSDSISAIVFSAMCIEAFVNESAENVLNKEQLNDFSFMKNEFKRRGKGSSLSKKVKLIFDIAFNVSPANELTESIDDLVDLRNNLVHYKLTDTAMKYIYPPLEHTETGDDQKFTCIDFMQEPKRIIVPFVEKVTGQAAMKCYETADSVLELWNSKVEESTTNEA